MTSRLPIPYRTAGPEDGPPVYFLHGFLGAAGDWDDVVEPLAETQRCVILDLPGHGWRANESDPLFQRGAFARALRDLARSLGDDSLALVGYSMGGRLALEYAVTYPDAVEKLALVSTSPGIEQGVDRAARRALDEARAAQILSNGLEVFLREWYAMPLFHPLNRQSDLFEELIAGRAQNNPAALAAALRAFSPGVQPCYIADLPKLTVPVLLVAGEHDDAYVKSNASMAAQLPNATRMVIPESGHAVHLTHPRELQTALTRFLSR